MTPEVHRYLEGGLQHLGELRHNPLEDEAARLWVARFSGALEALQVAELLTDDEFGDWMDHLGTAAAGSGAPVHTSPDFPGPLVSVSYITRVPGSPPPPPPPPVVIPRCRVIPGQAAQVQRVLHVGRGIRHGQRNLCAVLPYGPAGPDLRQRARLARSLRHRDRLHRHPLVTSLSKKGAPCSPCCSR
jgi:hypothetical protein